MDPDLLREIVARYEADGAVVRETADGQPVLARPMATRAKLSPLPVERKKQLALAKGVPAPGSGLPGEWQDDDARRVLRLPVTDETPDRHGTIILADGWDFSAYEANPVFIAQHAADGLPLGLVLSIQSARILGVDGKRRKGYSGDVLFSRADLSPDAEVYFRNYLAGRMKMTSVGFIPRSFRRITKKEVEAFGADPDTFIIEGAELVELSAVTVGSNPSMVARGERVAAVRAFLEAAKAGAAPVLGRAELAALYGEDAVAEVGEGLPDHGAPDLGWDQVIAAAEAIELACQEPIQLASVEDQADDDAGQGAQEPAGGDPFSEARALLEEALRDLDDGEPEGQGGDASGAGHGPSLEPAATATAGVIEINGQRYVPESALATARLEVNAALLARDLLALCLRDPDHQPAGDALMAAMRRAVAEAVEPIETALEEMRAEVERVSATRSHSADPAPEDGGLNGDGLRLYDRILDLTNEARRLMAGERGKDK